MTHLRLSKYLSVCLDDDGNLTIDAPDEQGVILDPAEVRKLAQFLADSKLSPRA